MKSALVVCLDSKVRNLAFTIVSQRGFRVDAVADSASAERRFAKDEYDWVIAQRDVLSPNVSPEGATITVVDEGMDRAELLLLLNRNP